MTKLFVGEDAKSDKQKISTIQTGVVIHCYRVKKHIAKVLASIEPIATRTYVITDADPKVSGALLKTKKTLFNIFIQGKYLGFNRIASPIL